MKLEARKRYYWTNYDGRSYSGLFTGEFKKNGNAIFMTKSGDTWSVPPRDVSKSNQEYGRK